MFDCRKTIICIVAFLMIISCLSGCREKSNDTNDVELGDYSNLKISVEKGTVTEANVKAYIEKLIDYYSPDNAVPYEKISDDFVLKNLSDTGYKTVEELKNGIFDYLNQKNEYYAKNNTNAAVKEKLMEICSVKNVSKELLNDRTERQVKIFKSGCQKQYGMTFEDYLKNCNLTEESFRKQTEDSTKKSIIIEKILLKIAEKENVTVDEKEYEEYVDQMIKNYGYSDKNSLFEDYGEKNIKNMFVCEKTVELIAEKADVTYVAPGSLS